MPWCPKCKSEFRDEITVCSDCGTTLIAEIEEDTTSLAEITEEEQANKLIEFLQYEGITDITCEYVEESNHWLIKVNTDSYKRANKLFLAFRKTEAEENVDVNERANLQKEPDISLTYVKKETQYNDLVSTTYTFLLFGIVGSAFLILNVMGIIDFVNSLLMYVVMGFMFIAFIIIGISSHASSKRVKNEIGTENELTNQVNSWLKDNITQDFLNEIQDDNESPEINYFHKSEKIKTLVSEQFNIPDDAFLEHVVEEFYNSEIDHI